MCKKNYKKQKKTLNFEILVEWNHFLVRLKPLLPAFFDNISNLTQNTFFWMHSKWSGVL